MTKPISLRPLAALFSLGLCGIPLVGMEASAAPAFQMVDSFHLGPQQPYAPVVRDAYGNIYGAGLGGANGTGVIYKVATDGTITNLHNFGPNGGWGALILASDGNLYGTAAVDGDQVVYRLTTSGVFTVLHVFSATTDGRYPSNLVQAADGTFYGTADEGGANDRGTIFKITAGGVFTKLADLANDTVGYRTIGLIQGADGDFYGLNHFTNDSTSPEAGSLFRVTSSGSLSVVGSFTSVPGLAFSYLNGLMQASDGNFYVTSQYGGTGSFGAIYKVTPAGSISLLAESTWGGYWEPKGVLAEGSDGALYGSSFNGGEGEGLVFRVTTTGDFSILTTFTQSNNGPIRPQAGLIAGADGNLYGTSQMGGNHYGGTVFKITPTGDLSMLAEFDVTSPYSPDTRLAEGGDGFLYGTTLQGGVFNRAVFKVGKQGGITGLSDIPEWGLFDNTGNGGYYYDGLREGFDGNLLGVTPAGGAGIGMALELSTSGDFTVLHEFGEDEGFFPSSILKTGPDEAYGFTTDDYASYAGTFFKMNASGDVTTLGYFDAYDFGIPNGGMIRASDGNFYGTTPYSEGGGGYGAVFRVTPDGTISLVVNFDDTDGISYPMAGVTEGPDGNLYGLCAFGGGPEGYGSAYKLALDGTVTLLKTFDVTSGAMPNGELELGPDGALYGTTYGGGAHDYGTVFRLTTDGTFTVIHDFDIATGVYPMAGLLRASDGDLYGTTTYGGTTASGIEGGGGQIFRIHFGADVTTVVADGPASSSATLNATVNPGGYATTVTFEYGTSPTLSGATTVSGGVIPAGTTAVPVTGSLTGLAPSTTYYFRALASNGETPVVQKGEILSFTTPEAAHLGVSASGHAVADGGKVIAGWAVTGHSTDVTLTIQNTSTSGTLTGIGASVSGGDASQFTVLTAPATSLAPGASTTAVIRFTPSSTGIKGTTLAITSSDPDDTSHEVLLRGAGLTPAQARVAAVIRWILSLL